MKCTRILISFCVCLVVNLLVNTSSHAATVYISDELTVPMRSGPSGAHRILHKGLPSGTQMEVIGEDKAAGFSQIRTTRGTEGWIRSQYLVSQPIAKARLASAQRALSKAQADLAAAQQNIAQLTASNRESGQANTTSQKRISSLETELAELKRISAGAIEEHATNQSLLEVNARLKDELDDLAETRARLEDNSENEALMIGAALIFLGLIAGVLIKARPQRSAWN